MTQHYFLVGPLAYSGLMDILKLSGEPSNLQGQLVGGSQAGIAQDSWPELVPSSDLLPAIRVVPSPALMRYAEVMGLVPVLQDGKPVLGVQTHARAAGNWSEDRWDAGLAVRIADLILRSSPGLSSAMLARRLPMLGVWAASQIRAQASAPSGGPLVARRGAADARMIDHQQPFAEYFAVESAELSYRAHEGGFTPQAKREAFIMGDAVAALPWDPRRDRVLVIEQFRFAPALRMDPQPWLLEPVAGRVDAGETVEDAARREALEEADVELRELFPAVHSYPSPGAVTEYLYLYVGIADLPDDAAGVHGLDNEAEDIRGHLIDREELFRMVLAGEISNGPLAMLSMWLQTQHQRLLAELSETAAN